MFISKKHQVKDIEVIYKDLTRTYLNSIKEVVSVDDLPKFKESTYLISEGYRTAMCLALNLDTETSTSIVKKYELGFKEVLLPLCKKYKLDKLSSEQKKGLLEACVHCIEMSRKLVSN